MANEQIKVSANAGLLDGLQAAARSAVVVVGFITAALGLLKVHDIAAIITLIQTNGGETLAAVSALIAFGTATYGALKSSKRGGQLASVAANPKVPDSVATLK